MSETEIKSELDRLKREKEWVESILKSVADPIVLTDLNNYILTQNQRASQLFGDGEFDSSPRRDAIERNRRTFNLYISRHASSIDMVCGELTMVDPDKGAELHFEVVSTPSRDGGNRIMGIVTVFRDVTALRRAGRELEEQFYRLQKAEARARSERDRFNLILENVGLPIVVCDKRSNFILLNRRAETFFREQSGLLTESLEAIAFNESTFRSFISKLALDFDALEDTERELVDPRSGDRLIFNVISRKICGESGEISAIVSILHDLTEMRELEHRRVEQQLFESEKMAAIGRMTAQIAHEVNNPLEVIKNSLYLLETASPVTQREPQTLRFLEIARKETERVSEIIKQMLGFPRNSGKSEVVIVNVNQMLEEMLVLLEKPLRQSRIDVIVSLADNVPSIIAAADQLKQVLLNLILNSQQAMENGGTLTITTSLVDEMSEDSLIKPSVIVEITDTGVGIDERDLLNIFDPFYSVGKGKKGTGLGLWVSQAIVRNFGGRIKVKSKVGKGSTFFVILPFRTPERVLKS